MGYDLHITRKKDWTEEGSGISESEWIDVVSTDSQFTLGDTDTVKTGDPLMGVWSGHSSGQPVLFFLKNGQIQIKNPDKETTAKLKEIAAKLQARVQGDDRELY